jgi:hypothetical protein
LALLASALVWPYTASGQDGNGSTRTVEPRRPVTYKYTVEWRLIDAGTATLNIKPSGTAQYPSVHSELLLASTGLVSKLYKVNDRYLRQLHSGTVRHQLSDERGRGRRRRETPKSITTHAQESHLLRTRPGQEYCGSRQGNRDSRLRARCDRSADAIPRYNLEPGKSAEFPVSDGKKFGMVRVEAQEREQVKVKGVTHKTVRYEAFIFNGVIYPARRALSYGSPMTSRLAVQIRVRMNFPIGNIT